jgi:[1-hydroxy-2-(trimethylamino)ethyl]phosphonate dioxygenase
MNGAAINEMETRSSEVMRLMRYRGSAAYLGEPVSQLEHALQAAWLATQAGSPAMLVAAALLHDIGHLLPDPEHGGDEGVDTPHEEIGHQWLLARFGPAVAEPVRLHVAAKRYLCGVDPEYRAALSPTSVRSRALQGGPFSVEQAREFEGLCWHRDAVQLRRWDDAAKQPGLAVPPLEEYCALLDSVSPALA